MSGKKIVEWVNRVISILIFALLLTMLFTVIIMRASGGEASLFGYQIKSVLSGSMEPDIKTGSIIALQETGDDHEFKQNDVITFITEDGMTVTHRIDEVQDDGQSYITKGDANDAPDMDPVLQKDIIGLYNGFTIPYLGYVINFATSKEGSALLLVFPGMGLVLYSFLRIGRVVRSIDHSKKETESQT